MQRRGNKCFYKQSGAEVPVFILTYYVVLHVHAVCRVKCITAPGHTAWTLLSNSHTHLVGLRGQGIGPYQWPVPAQHTTSTPLAGFRARNPSKRAAADPRLRPRGHRDRPSYILQTENLLSRTSYLLADFILLKNNCLIETRSL